ncbi:MAG: hypothetical protein ABLQ96_12835, partial [Candidatus Acidiferrum sp.]
ASMVPQRFVTEAGAWSTAATVLAEIIFGSWTCRAVRKLIYLTGPANPFHSAPPQVTRFFIGDK